MFAIAQVNFFCAKGKGFCYRIVACAIKGFIVIHHIGFFKFQFFHGRIAVPLDIYNAAILSFEIVAHPLIESGFAIGLNCQGNFSTPGNWGGPAGCISFLSQVEVMVQDI